jgi:hypothetical protein
LWRIIQPAVVPFCCVHRSSKSLISWIVLSFLDRFIFLSYSCAIIVIYWCLSYVERHEFCISLK